MCTNDTDSDSSDATCPTCGDTFASNRGMKSHHYQIHGESVAGFTKTCEWCGEEFTARRKDGQKHCSPECGHKGGGVKRSGSDAYQWKGDGEGDDPWCDESHLRELYIDEQLTTYELANRFGCNETTVWKWLKRHGIPTRERGKHRSERPWRDEETLRRLYVEEGHCISEVAEELGCAMYTIQRWLSRNGIETRSRAPWDPEDHPSWEGGPETYNCEWCDGEFTAYPAKGQRCCSKDCDNAWRVATGLFAGENHPCYTNGEYVYGAGWNFTTKEAVRESQNRRCDGCGMHESEHIEEFGRRLEVHHVMKASSLQDAPPEVRNDMENLVALCKGNCHPTAERMAPLYPFAD